MKRLIVIGLSAASLVAWVLPSTASAYNNCGERKVGHLQSKIIKERGMRCRSATELAGDYERKAAKQDAFVLGTVLQVHAFRCKYKSYFDPFDVAYVCRSTNGRKKMKALYPPEREG